MDRVQLNTIVNIVGAGALAIMANATGISEEANEALVYAQELAVCRALGG